MTQKKITEKAKEEEFLTPIETLLSFLHLPHKIYRDIYISVIERRLSTKPLMQSEESIAFLAQRVGVEPGLMAEKIRSMVRMKWIEHEQVGRRDVNQLFVLSPVWRYKPGMDKNKFAIALQQYRIGITEDTAHQMNTKEIYELMNSVCPHTGEKIDKDVCKSLRWDECKTCLYKSEEGIKNEAT